jgi:hypothetical protein
MWQLRAATSLARLWREQGRRGEARDLLAPPLRLLHRRLRHRRPERPEGIARRVDVSQPPACDEPIGSHGRELPEFCQLLSGGDAIPVIGGMRKLANRQIGLRPV